MFKKLIALTLSLALLTACSVNKRPETEGAWVFNTQAADTTAFEQAESQAQTDAQTEYVSDDEVNSEPTATQAVHQTEPDSTSDKAKPAETETTTAAKPVSTTKNPKPTQAVVQSGSVRAVWVTYYELKAMFGNGESGFRKKAQQTIDTCVKNNINTLFLQVRPYFDAVYPSEIFDWSVYALDDNGNPPSFDPLEIFVKSAHEKGIALHAWINPYRISYDKEYKVDKKYSDIAVRCDAGVYLLPSSEKSQKLVLDGIREILNNYSVDGIHIDDYFYPTTSADFDAAHYKAYTSGGGKLNLKSWRQENVNSLVSAMYSLVHSSKSNAIFSISPAANIEKNKNEYYADVELWCRQSGYADWIMPQIYFGYKHATMPFKDVVKQWENLAGGGKVKLICGLAAYKVGEKDSNAGSAANEWIEDPTLLQSQINYIASNKKWLGYALFSMSNLK